MIHSQITDPEKVIEVLANELDMEEESVRERVEKVSSIERIRKNVEKEVGDRIRNYGLDGVKVDEDYKRYYPYGETASKVLGFTGADNQGIIGLEVAYDEVLQGTPGENPDPYRRQRDSAGRYGRDQSGTGCRGGSLDQPGL